MKRSWHTADGGSWGASGGSGFGATIGRTTGGTAATDEVCMARARTTSCLARRVTVLARERDRTSSSALATTYRRPVVGRPAAVRYVRTVTSEQVREALSEFVRERDWDQFHSPANLAKSISIEAAELLECFQWSEDADEARVHEELADVVTYCILLAERLRVDLDKIVLEKLAVTKAKYPADKSRGRSTKYDSL